jgi:type IV pilus assembly protein PilP
MTTQRTFVMLAVLAVVAAACGSEEAAAPAPTPAPRPRPAAAAVAGPADGGSDDANLFVYSYNPVGKRDPFRSPIGEIKPKGAEGSGDTKTDGCDEPLCVFDIEQLTLVAVVSGDANPVAMLEDPNKVGHIIRRNTKVGKQGGKVTQILRDCVVVTEYFLGPDGKKNPNRVNICVKQEAAQAPTIDLMQNKAIE